MSMDYLVNLPMKPSEIRAANATLSNVRDVCTFCFILTTVPDSFQNTDSINGFRGLFGLNRAII
jgi:hypothetical protein